jgi:hypothetical protein
MCLFCVLQADPATKLVQARRWHEHIDLAPQDIDTLDTLIAGHLLSNTLIADEYAEIGRYLVCRLIDPALAGNVVTQHGRSLDARHPSLTLNTLWQRVAGHPLNASFVSLKQSA